MRNQVRTKKNPPPTPPYEGGATRGYTLAMFTGIVQARGRIAALDPTPTGARLVVDPLGWSPRGITFSHGDSICVSGVCLTLVAQDAGRLAFDVVAETLAKTKLGDLAIGSDVNLEPSLTPTTQLGGHFLQGHVDGVGNVTDVNTRTDDYRVTIEPPVALMDYIVPKGSVAIDGVSLTIASVSRGAFEVALIPTTLSLTTLGALAKGSRVNLESDVVTRTIVHWLRRQTSKGEGVTIDTLRAAGFLSTNA